VIAEFFDNFHEWFEKGYIYKEDWDFYYSAVSLSIDNDEHFIQLIKTLWRLN